MFEDVLQEGLNKGFRGGFIPDERGEIEAFRVLNYLTQDSLKYLLEQLSREQVQFLKEHSDYKAWDTLGEKINQYEDTSKGHEWAESEVNNEALQILQVITKTFNVGKFELLKRGKNFQNQMTA